ncbi:MAG TPA: nuclease-related domain-containing protein [Cellulomonas sp.]
MTEVALRRWTRYGKDRLYLAAPDGRSLGWYDLTTGEHHEVPADQADAVDAAVRRWLLAHAGTQAETTSSVPAPAGLPGPETAPAGRTGPELRGSRPGARPELERDPEPEHDLAANRPGASPREQALARRRAAPVRTFLARALGVRTDERAWRIGADGEEKVAAQIDRLIRRDPRWRVLHSVPVGAGDSDIDHVLVGPGGVCTLNTKHHPGARIWVHHDAVRVNGSRVPYVRNARFEAARASRMLTAVLGWPVEVTGVIVPVNAADLTIKAAPADVAIVNRRRLDGWLASRPERLDAAGAEAIFTAARRPATWRTAAR